MIRKVALFVFYNLYESKRYFAQKLSESLNQLGVETLILDQGSIDVGVYNRLVEFGPDFTLSFNTMGSDPKGKFLWDYLETPHLNALVDPAFYAIPSFKSPFSIFSSVDREDCKWLQNVQNLKAFFWPHAVDSKPFEKKEKIYEVIFTGTCTDYLSLEKQFLQALKKEESDILEVAIQIMLTMPLKSLIEALLSALKEFEKEPKEVDFARMFYFLDHYVRGKDRLELIKAIRDVPVHIFGEASWINPIEKVSWKEYLGDQPNVILHPSVSYAESFDITAKSKICLNSTPFFKHGSHERILNALVSDSLPLTTHNGFVEEFFEPGKDLLTYQIGEWDKVNEQVNSILANGSLRKEMVEAGRKKVLESHTWDVRAKELIQHMNTILVNF